MRVVLVGPPAVRLRLRSQLPDGIEIVAEQETMDGWQTVEADAFLIAPRRQDAGEPLFEPLTARESQVLDRLAKGLSNKMIAADLRISDETVKFHLAAIFGKLGASNRTDAVRLAIGRGLVSI
ncbi:MAG: LuxR C-terminal-related transcriptional regulator [Vicinamibacterales bacterium]